MKIHSKRCATILIFCVKRPDFQEMNERFELAEIEARNEVLKKRIDRIKAHLKDIKYEP